jgi:NhaC family Na+:H+ antiporter
VAVTLDPDRVIQFAASPDLAPWLAAIKGVWMALANGYVANSGSPGIDVILTRGGMSSMMSTLWLIMAALAFGATVEHAGLINRLIDPVIKGVKSTGGLVASLVGTCIGANIVTSDQYISIALPGRLFRPEFLKRGLAPVMLSRVVGDSATVTSPLIPWNSCGAYMAAALGVSTTSYAIYCFFNFLNPIVTIAFAVLGLRVIRETATPSASA